MIIDGKLPVKQIQEKRWQIAKNLLFYYAQYQILH